MMGKEEAVDYSKIPYQYLLGSLSKTTKIIRIANRRAAFHTWTSKVIRSSQLLGYFLWYKMEKFYFPGSSVPTPFMIAFLRKDKGPPASHQTKRR
jgi:hypothetical protein